MVTCRQCQKEMYQLECPECQETIYHCTNTGCGLVTKSPTVPCGECGADVEQEYPFFYNGLLVCENCKAGLEHEEKDESEE
jgi:hypothetical protein